MSVQAPGEKDLLAALRAGDQDAFRQLVEDYDPGLRRFARGYVSAAVAEEAVGDTWAAVARAIDRFEGRSSVKTWIYRILLNKVRTLGGREGKSIPFSALGHGRDDGEPLATPEQLAGADRGPGFLIGAPQPWDDMPAEELERAELLEMILESIEQLPPAQREVVELRDLEGFSAAEVSQTLGITSVNQRVLLHRGRVAVRNRLQEYLTHAG